MEYATGKCCTCKHGAADPDGFYCAHPVAMAESIFGRSPQFMLNGPNAHCKDFKLAEACTCTRKHCPRHGNGDRS
jgi:hypothetical protein